MPGREVIKHEPKQTVVEENDLGLQVLSVNYAILNASS